MIRLLIVDGHAYAYRAYHAIRELSGPSGQPVNAIYGFVKMLQKMRLALAPSHLIVVWDGGLDAGRLAAHPEYKSHRPEMPEGLRPQLDELVQYLSAAGIAGYRGDGIEADDYIACLARRTAAAGHEVVIASSDKDFMQLVSSQIGLFNPNDKTGVVWTREQVVAKTGVEPEQVVDWLALIGDAVDNIPGVPGVGPKTATELLKQFGSAAALLARLDEVKSEKTRSALRDSAAAVRRNVALIRLCEVPCDFSLASLLAKPANQDKLRALFQRWGFKGMLVELEDRPMERQAELI